MITIEELSTLFELSESNHTSPERNGSITISRAMFDAIVNELKGENMNNLEKLRSKHNYTQSDLAEHLGVTKACICFAENKSLSPRMAKKCADFLGENVYDVLGKDIFKIAPSSLEDIGTARKILNTFEEEILCSTKK